MTVSINYTVKWRLKDNPNYVWTSCKKLVNINTGREIKKTLKGLMPGYWIGKKFIPLAVLANNIEPIKKSKCPF